jgi:hypothetical protein
MQNFDHNIVFEKNANLLSKIVKIAENCDHNIDPRLGAFLPPWLWALFLKITLVCK